MDLGTTISRLRAERSMSQGDLAEALDVSRQSISKWETNASVPELDKLVKLSRLFGVSLDQLVTGEAPAAPEMPCHASPAAPAPPEPAPTQKLPGHRLAGIILLCMAFLIWLLLTVMGGPLEGLVLAAPFLLCAAICFACRRRAGLFCAWTVYLSVELYLRWATGITWGLVLMTPSFEPWMNYTRLAIAWVQFFAMLLMFFLTIRSFRTVHIDLKNRRNLFLLIVGWTVLATLYLLRRWGFPLLFHGPAFDTSLGFRLLLKSGDVLLLALLAALLTATVCGLRTLRQKEA
ncbi:helix-turn-helix domain-containing protein [uncultured Dysosmobacter sp.]|uniref:helix-turn-helix domain-containing protein n=1 Tax=uncultured Dysosmobacter sp. TaxID=2591384 RepID=UPI002637B6FE|nr:helix-turn-helix transcriptional regulator [uncultured Dysosmobacter sp.]